MNTCALTRLLVPAALVGMAVTTITNNDVLGWTLAAVTGGVIWAVQSVRGTRASCAIDLPPGVEPAERVDLVTGDRSTKPTS
ncbi:MAG: hypothetical protein R2726_11810 [Acidimicrobiales bacterium]